MPQQNENTKRVEFATTNWSVVLAAAAGGDSRRSSAALERLCRAYWYPLYAFIRRNGHGPHDAQDLTQEYFARLLAKDYLASVDQSKGKFRSFLLSSLKHFIANERARTKTKKRGGNYEFITFDPASAESRYGLEPAPETPPEILYDRQWAVTLLERVMVRLRREYVAAGKKDLFENIKEMLIGDKHIASHSDLATRANLSEETLKVTIHRLRRRYRELIRTEVANTLTSGDEVDEELRYLFEILRG